MPFNNCDIHPCWCNYYKNRLNHRFIPCCCIYMYKNSYTSGVFTPCCGQKKIEDNYSNRVVYRTIYTPCVCTKYVYNNFDYKYMYATPICCFKGEGSDLSPCSNFALATPICCIAKRVTYCNASINYVVATPLYCIAKDVSPYFNNDEKYTIQITPLFCHSDANIRNEHCCGCYSMLVCCRRDHEEYDISIGCCCNNMQTSLLMTSAPKKQEMVEPPPKVHKSDTCVICLDATPDNVFVCGHQCVCKNCQTNPLFTNKCPICRVKN